MPDAFTRFAAAAGPADPPGLQLLFDGPPDIPTLGLEAAVREYHPDLAPATVEMIPSADIPAGREVVSADGPPPAYLGLISWANHAVKLIAFAAPMPAAAAEMCLRTALLPPDLKADARNHAGHVLLYYAGTHASPLEQLAAVAAVAGCLARFGAIVTLNEEARAAVASIALLPDDPGEDMLHTLRTLPLPYLYGGFVKMELTDIPGVWVRTHANPRLGVPNFAFHMPSHADGERVFALFAAAAAYLLETGLTFELDELVRIDDIEYRVREPAPAEWWLDGGGPMRVLAGA